ncbi:hypothetical protein VQ045_15135 [Aurantimonas sp. E1-2-R+4]|uniref:hypothetical protein n=1 Tax=Aurantimonas sp. E1-2-R+4 TaxID=3113714 RepID=UPI002F922930
MQMRPHAATEVVSIGGGCHETPALCLLEEVDGRQVVRLTPEEIAKPKPGIAYKRLMSDPGDGRVTRQSLVGHGIFASEALTPFDPGVVRFLCIPHSQIASDPTFRDNLLGILLK